MKCPVVCVVSRSLFNSVRQSSSLADCRTASCCAMTPVFTAAHSAKSLPFLNFHTTSSFSNLPCRFRSRNNLLFGFPSSANLVLRLHSDKKTRFMNSGRLQKTKMDASNSDCGKAVSRHLTMSTKAILEASPLSLQPYLKLIRFDRPIGTWLLFLPCTWSISLAAPAGHLPDIQMLALFALGSFSMRAAACTINDMWDKDYDARVARTRDRPLACGQISQSEALTFLVLPLSVSLAILLTFNWNTVALGACSVIPCVAYPLMKRFTYWPQAFLGLTLNWGVMIAWTAIHGSLDLPGFALYLSCVFWTMIYDTIYAHQDKSDDILVGVKSTALKFGDQSKIWLSLFASGVTGGLTTAGYLCNQPWLYYGGVSIVMGHLAHQIYSVDLDDPESCGKTFRANRNLGLVFWAFVVAAGLLSDRGPDEAVEDLCQY